MLKRDLKKHHQLNIKRTVDQFDNMIITNVLLKKYLNLDYEINVKHVLNDELIKVTGTIKFKVLLTDARDGHEIVHDQVESWDEEYLLAEYEGETIDFDQLACEQINLNIPMNLSHNYDKISKVGPGWQLMSEDEYVNNKKTTSDPRWDKLKQYYKYKK